MSVMFFVSEDELRSSARRIGRPMMDGNVCAGKSADGRQLVHGRALGEWRTRAAVSALDELQGLGSAAGLACRTVVRTPVPLSTTSGSRSAIVVGRQREVGARAQRATTNGPSASGPGTCA